MPEATGFSSTAHSSLSPPSCSPKGKRPRCQSSDFVRTRGCIPSSPLHLYWTTPNRSSDIPKPHPPLPSTHTLPFWPVWCIPSAFRYRILVLLSLGLEGFFLVCLKTLEKANFICWSTVFKRKYLCSSGGHRTVHCERRQAHYFPG